MGTENDQQFCWFIFCLFFNCYNAELYLSFGYDFHQMYLPRDKKISI
jgi:hypothetical protein